MVENKKAYYDYEILEEYECGMKLEGWEVKAIAGKSCSIAGSHCVINGNIVTLVGATMGSSDKLFLQLVLANSNKPLNSQQSSKALLTEAISTSFIRTAYYTWGWDKDVDN